MSGDIIGLHNHGTIQIGDTFSGGEELRFTGIPHFAPELFRRIRLADPMKSKQLQKGLQQLAEEGSTQVFAPLTSTDLIVGAVGQLQFDVVAYRLKDEYKVEARYEPVNVYTARWIYCEDAGKLGEFREEGGRAPVHGRRWPPDLPRPQPGQPVPDAGALAGPGISRHPGALIGGALFRPRIVPPASADRGRPIRGLKALPP